MYDIHAYSCIHDYCLHHLFLLSLYGLSHNGGNTVSTKASKGFIAK